MATTTTTAPLTERMTDLAWVFERMAERRRNMASAETNPELRARFNGSAVAYKIAAEEIRRALAR